jgi:predicted acylesterase/phospholipase RssA
LSAPPSNEIAVVPGRRALVLGGGGITGAAYEIGCLTALDRFLAPEHSTFDFELVSGVSAGSIIASAVAQRIAPGRIFEAISNGERSVMNFSRSDIYRADWRGAFRQLRGSLVRIGRILLERRRQRERPSLTELMAILQEQLPSGLFSLEPMESYFARSFSELGVPDHFRDLECELYISATDIDSGRQIVFGTPEEKDVRISQAITASCAIPTFFRPVQIGSRYFIDGVYSGLRHLEIVLERGARLAIYVNPLVPIDNSLSETYIPSVSSGEFGSVAELGIGMVREQADRVHARFKLENGLRYLRQKYSDADILLLEPPRTETSLFLQSPMAFGARNDVMHFAFQLTQNHLKRNRDKLREMLARHGLRIA